ncbi:odorant receptor 4-like [Battus philenor]|uniref:odorant receptor 4-like n=1 Tax=Battus philenor TaxID=42288 RepID=UPI0035CF826C
MSDYKILKSFCRKIYFVGSGNFWYEQSIGDDNKLLYKTYICTLFFMYGFMTLLEIAAAVIGTLPKDEKNDSVAFAVSHTVVMIKIFSVIYNKRLIRKLNYDMVHVCQEYEDELLQKEKYFTIKINVIAYFVAVYGSAACFIFEGLRKMKEGSHFITVVTYYPSFEDNSYVASIFRIYSTIVLLMMLMTMIVSVDTFTMVNLIMYKYKIITLRKYFENLSAQFNEINESGDQRFAIEMLTKGLIKGFKMHTELLRILRVIDQAFGIVISLQLCQSSGSAISLLLQIALAEKLTFMANLKIIFFVIALFFLLGRFLCNAGEITYQAALLADSIFYCGWHACSGKHQLKGKKIGPLVLFAYTQAQKPLILKAFKMIELTHRTYLMVIKGTYSVFTLFNSQNSNSY